MWSHCKIFIAPAVTFALVGVAFTHSSCTKSTQKTLEDFEISQEEREMIEAYQAEVEIGRNMAGRLLQYYGSFGDTNLIGYLNQVGAYVASYSDYPERRYSFAVLDTDMVNAFACPGGYILVTLGAIRNARNEAELGMVLGHEIAHVGHKHMFNTLQKMTAKKREDIAKDVEKRGGSKIPETMKVRQREVVTEKSETLSTVSRYLGATAGAALGALQAAKAGMSLILEKGLDKKLEYQADREGTKYGIRAGYDPKALTVYLKRLEEGKKNIDTKVLAKTHPRPIDRRKRIAKLLNEMKANEIVGAKGEKRFMKYHKDLPEKKKRSST